MRYGESVRASAANLARLGVQTAADLAALNPGDARALMTVTGGRTVYELRGISCLPLELMEPTQEGNRCHAQLRRSGDLLAAYA